MERKANRKIKTELRYTNENIKLSQRKVKVSPAESPTVYYALYTTSKECPFIRSKLSIFLI